MKENFDSLYIISNCKKMKDDASIFFWVHIYNHYLTFGSEDIS